MPVCGQIVSHRSDALKRRTPLTFGLLEVPDFESAGHGSSHDHLLGVAEPHRFHRTRVPRQTLEPTRCLIYYQWEEFSLTLKRPQQVKPDKNGQNS